MVQEKQEGVDVPACHVIKASPVTFQSDTVSLDLACVVPMCDQSRFNLEYTTSVGMPMNTCLLCVCVCVCICVCVCVCVCACVCVYSSAIMKYLVKKYNLPDHWYPKDDQKQAKVDEYLFWHAANLRHGAGYQFFLKVANWEG